MIKIPRNPRKFLKSSFFHVIVQGIDKENIFQEKRYKFQYLIFLKKEIKKVDVKIKAFCVMDNHIHLLINTDNIENASKLMQKVNSQFARYYNYMKNGRVGYVFRGRFLSEPIKDKKYFIQCIKYIHLNPVKAGIVKKCEEYKFSSYKYYQKKKNNDTIEQKDNILTKQDYIDICNSEDNTIIFKDVNINIKQELLQGISEFLKKEQINVAKVFIDREILTNLIKFLKNVKQIKYTTIRKELGISRGTMESITENIRKGKKDVKNNKY